jgi:hypothetical protein
MMMYEPPREQPIKQFCVVYVYASNDYFTGVLQFFVAFFLSSFFTHDALDNAT